jgi:ribosomal-protein-alanine N-acetyltransferase
MISYRAAIQLDLPVLVSMERVLFADSPWTTGQFKEAFQGVPTIRHFLVATNEQDQIVGYAAVLVVAPGVEADVLTVAVLPEYARKGIATHFMGELEKWSLDKQASGDPFYTAKLHTARFYFAKLLPETASLIRTARAGLTPLMAMDEALF